MIKALILKDENTNMYFTGNYNQWWSKDINDAYIYNPSINIDNILNRYKDEFDNPFEKVNYLELMTFYVNK